MLSMMVEDPRGSKKKNCSEQVAGHSVAAVDQNLKFKGFLASGMESTQSSRSPLPGTWPQLFLLFLQVVGKILRPRFTFQLNQK